MHPIIISLTISLFFSLSKQTNIEEIEGRIRLDNQNNWIIETKNFSSDYLYVATAFYNPLLNEKGWDILHLTTNELFSDEIQAEGAGRLEASLTKERIYNHYLNAKSSNGILTDNVKNFFKEQEDYIIKMRNEEPNNIYFYNAYLIYLQFKGLRDQYNKEVEGEKKLEGMELYLINSFGDLFEINSTFYPKKIENMTYDEIKEYLFINNHCSCLFKVKNDFSDIFLGHNSWYFYTMMTRIFKEYNLNFNHPSIKCKTVYFTSYPGSIVSNDDFYVTSNDLSIIETTNSNMNVSIYKEITYNSLLNWQRVQIANRLSTNAKEWTEHFAYNQSGTYNNMYMVLDMKKVDLEKKIIENDAMKIIETLPKYYVINDITDYLKRGYWPSYNVPFSDEIYKKSLIDYYIKKNPKLKESYDYNMCSRAQILRKYQSDVIDLESFMKLMRYNNFEKEPMAYNDPTNTISARGDLRKKGSCFGAFDCKVTSVKDLKGKDKKFYLYGGPTNIDTPQFKWNETKSCENVTHFGLNNEPNFGWFEINNKFK